MFDCRLAELISDQDYGQSAVVHQERALLVITNSLITQLVADLSHHVPTFNRLSSLLTLSARQVYVYCVILVEVDGSTAPLRVMRGTAGLDHEVNCLCNKATVGFNAHPPRQHEHQVRFSLGAEASSCVTQGEICRCGPPLRVQDTLLNLRAVTGNLKPGRFWEQTGRREGQMTQGEEGFPVILRALDIFCPLKTLIVFCVFPSAAWTQHREKWTSQERRKGGPWGWGRFWGALKPEPDLSSLSCWSLYCTYFKSDNTMLPVFIFKLFSSLKCQFCLCQ